MPFRVACIFLITIAIFGCEDSKTSREDHTPPKIRYMSPTFEETWEKLKSYNSRDALGALNYLDRYVKKGLSRKEVLRRFPKGSLVEVEHKKPPCYYGMRFNTEWNNRVFADHGGINYYYICFDKDGKVLETELLLDGDE